MRWLAALLRLTALLVGVARAFESFDVASGEALVKAVQEGVRHIVVRTHVNLEPFSKYNRTIDGGARPALLWLEGYTASIQGRCPDPYLGAPVRGELHKDSELQCVVRASQDVLGVWSLTGQRTWVSSLYVLMVVDAASDTDTRVLGMALFGDAVVYLQDVTFAGDPFVTGQRDLVCRGVELSGTSRVHMQGCTLADLYEEHNPGVNLVDNTTASLSQCTLRNLVITSNSRNLGLIFMVSNGTDLPAVRLINVRLEAIPDGANTVGSFHGGGAYVGGGVAVHDNVVRRSVSDAPDGLFVSLADPEFKQLQAEAQDAVEEDLLLVTDTGNSTRVVVATLSCFGGFVAVSGLLAAAIGLFGCVQRLRDGPHGNHQHPVDTKDSHNFQNRQDRAGR